MTDRVKINVLLQGDAVCGKEGYMLLKADDVAAFYLDGWGETGRIYPLSSSDSSIIDKVVVNIPSLFIEDGSDSGNATEICFPEFEGWNVHSVSGGKTMAICLARRERGTK